MAVIFAEDEVNTAVTALLNANTDLAAIVSTNIFDINSIPNNQGFPYIVLGETTGSVLDSFTKSGLNMTLAIHTWTRQGGKKQANSIRKLVFSTLHGAKLTMADFMGTMTFDSGNLMSDNSSGILLMHGTDRYRLKAL